ncbi:MAG: YihY/virulence factor BrkB family protein [Candidatus Angelobacter sp. Gp1-AA117]|nr:MAG: YihY/virulence factor BrkB family protein [Candidatus Angelobacter sp. Gp1-AA117]
MRLYKFNSKIHSQSVEKAKEKASPWKLGGLTPIQLGKGLYKEIDHDEVFTRSAALAYYFFTALIPMVFFMMSALGIFASHSEQVRTSLLNYFARVMPGDAFGLIEKTLKEVTTHSTGLKLILGLLLALWSGSGGMSSIMDALNRCYDVKDSRPYWKQKLISIALTVAISVLTIFALAIILYGGTIAGFVGAHTGLSDVTVMAWQVVQWPLALFFVVFSFALMYYWSPDAEQEWVWITPGSLVGVAVWIGASLLFRVYLHFFNSYSKTYGSLGAVMVLLLWLYISGLAILLGGEINSEIEHAAAKRGHPEAKEAGEKVA